MIRKISRQSMSAALLFLFILTGFHNADANNLQQPLYSKISTSFSLVQTVKCDKVKAKFEIYAEGDNYSMALKRLSKINNNFLGFLKSIFAQKDIKTSNAYGYSKTAALYVSVDSKRIDKISDVLRYIANRNFQYKTGIKPIYIRFDVSKDLRQKVRDALFKKALNAAKAKVKIVNETLSPGYKIGALNINFNQRSPVFYERNTFSQLYKSSAKLSSSNGANIETSPGSITIKVNVRLEMIKKIA